MSSQPTPADALAKLAVLTGLFEKLVADAGQRRAQIEQLLSELAVEHDDVRVLSSPPTRRAA